MNQETKWWKLTRVLLKTIWKRKFLIILTALITAVIALDIVLYRKAILSKYH